ARRRPAPPAGRPSPPAGPGGTAAAPPRPLSAIGPDPGPDPVPRGPAPYPAATMIDPVPSVPTLLRTRPHARRPTPATAPCGRPPRPASANHTIFARIAG